MSFWLQKPQGCDRDLTWYLESLFITIICFKQSSLILKSTQEILIEIATVKREIEDKYQALQKYLKETRSTFLEATDESLKLDNEDLDNHLNELKAMVNK